MLNIVSLSTLQSNHAFYGNINPNCTIDSNHLLTPLPPLSMERAAYHFVSPQPKHARLPHQQTSYLPLASQNILGRDVTFLRSQQAPPPPEAGTYPAQAIPPGHPLPQLLLGGGTVCNTHFSSLVDYLGTDPLCRVPPPRNRPSKPIPRDLPSRATDRWPTAYQTPTDILMHLPDTDKKLIFFCAQKLRFVPPSFLFDFFGI